MVWYDGGVPNHFVTYTLPAMRIDIEYPKISLMELIPSTEEFTQVNS
jgi:hypothetical protein